MLLVYHFIQTEKAMLYKEYIYNKLPIKLNTGKVITHCICFDPKFLALFMYMIVYLFVLHKCQLTNGNAHVFVYISNVNLKHILKNKINIQNEPIVCACISCDLK